MRRRPLVLLALRLVPRFWRDTVASDLDIEARALGRGSLWIAWHTLLVAARLRSTTLGDLMWTDLRYGVRSLLKSPGFTAAAILTLTLGIGANLVVFSVVDRVLFRPLPFADVDRLVFVSPFDPESGNRYYRLAKPLFVEGRRLPGIEDMASVALGSGFRAATEPATAPTLTLTDVTYNLLDVLGVWPVLGRGFSRADAEGRRAVAMLSHEVWVARFNADPDVIGLMLTNARARREVIGVLPPDFVVPAMNWSVERHGLSLNPDLMTTATPRDGTAPGVARLLPGVSLREAQAQFDALSVRLDPDLRQPGQDRGPRVLLQPVRHGMFWLAIDYMWLVSAAAAMVGLLGCVNLSSLLLARGRSRAQQVALRASLGATRARLMATEFLQVLSVSVVAAACSLVLIVWLSASVTTLVPEIYRSLVIDGLDGRLLGAAAIAALISSAIAGLMPAWTATRVSLIQVMQQGAPGAARASRGRSRGVILGVEAAIGLVLVAGAAFATRSFIGLVATDVGFNPAGLQILRIEPGGVPRGGDNAAELAYFRRVIENLRRQPGIERAAGIDVMPSSGMVPMTGAEWNGRARSGIWQITEDLVPTIEASVVAGRDISRADVDEERPVALVSRTIARQLWPDVSDQDVVGQVLSAPGEPQRHVIGIINDIRNAPHEPGQPMVLIPASSQRDIWFLELAVRTRGGRALDVEDLQRDLAGLGVTSVTSRAAGGRIRSALEQPRAQAIIFGSFGALGLLLAAFGLFAVASFDVALRRYEMGVRVALGASARQIRGLVVRDAVRPVVVGSAAGLLIAWWAGGFMQSLIHEVDARDPWTLALVILTLVATAVVAAWLPAGRAARTDPAVVLRQS